MKNLNYKKCLDGQNALTVVLLGIRNTYINTYQISLIFSPCAFLIHLQTKLQTKFPYSHQGHGCQLRYSAFSYFFELFVFWERKIV